MTTLAEAANLATSTGTDHIGYLTEDVQVQDRISGKIYTARSGAVVTCQFDNDGELLIAGVTIQGIALDASAGVDTETYAQQRARRRAHVAAREAERARQTEVIAEARRNRR